MNPIKRYPWFSLLFLLVIIAEIIGLTFYPEIRLASKGMIMATLIGLYIICAKRQSEVFLLGLIFALLGDAFLLFESDAFFLVGLGCFLIMQLAYAFTFWKKRRIPKPQHVYIAVAVAILPLILLAVGWSHIQGLGIPVFLYTASITAMLVTAYLRHRRLAGYNYVLLGAVLFMISDLVLGINRFIAPVPYASFLVMGTYIAAQYLIVTGILGDDKLNLHV